ncbi:NADP-dependent phosphogluconate dehydrogenase [Robiginitalea aestuariiviva]|uniref:NADP-dependent phosphogluconate dehydrogenase n=1 Tax=Robiginitalea aestuariiviva TaxID=3036903 RepID=UPI003B97EBA7
MPERDLSTFGLVGLGVMGRNFILNVADKGFTALGYDLDPEKAAALEKEGAASGRVRATDNLEAFVGGLERPRRIMLLVPAGKPVDAVIDALLPHLEAGDIIVDGGNSFYKDTDRREAFLKEKGIHFFGAGVSGGAEGARRGPSIMPGGSREAYAHLKPIFEAVAARYQNEPCVAYLGPKSAGNYVKMVHNGIEYALMQAIAETYDLLKHLGGLDNAQLAATFSRWNEGRLQSFLVEITSHIFRQPDPLGSGALVDRILDKAKQKGTGKWTSQNAMDLGIPVPSLDISVSMRQISALKPIREKAEGMYPKPALPAADLQWVEAAEATLYFTFITAYAQGMHLLSEASKAYGYELELGEIAKIWRAGCIIRAALLADITGAYQARPELDNLLLDPGFAEKVRPALEPTRRLVSAGIQHGIAIPTLAGSLSYFDAMSSGRLPLNLVQAQRDYFGAHTYERTDREGTFHTEW